MRGKIPTAIIAAITLGTLGFNVPHAAAAANCRVEDKVKADPGLSTRDAPGTIESVGGRGPNTVECSGTIQGGRVTGPGEIRTVGRYGLEDSNGSSCSTTNGRGDGRQTLTIPTDEGMKRITQSFTFTYSPTPRGVWDIEVKGEEFSGTGTARGTKGDCVSAPVSEFVMSYSFNGG